MYIHKHMLVGSNIDYFWSKKNKEPIIEHDNIVIHYTAGASAISSTRYMANELTPVSAHIVIARDGKVYQLVDFNTQAWHAGKSAHQGKINLNKFSVGIELDNAGKLYRREQKYHAWFGKQIPQEQVVKAKDPQTKCDAYWHAYTPMQLDTLNVVCKLLLETYPFRRIVGHSEISLSGKIDPGPAFPMEDFKKLIYR